MTAPTPTDQRRASLTRRIRLLVTATIAYNLVEAAVALSAGALASSTALIGFGLDSLIEVSSAAAVAWQFSARRPEVRQSRERRALRVIAVSFFALAAYVTLDALHTLLLGGTEAAPSPVGIAVAALSVVIMPALSLAQRRTGTALGSASAVADSKQTLLCAYLSAALLVGLLANALLGWAWADPTVALLIAVLALKEGRQAWKGDGCCAPAGIALAADPGTDACGCGPDCSCHH
ncbi:cation diffusion facilitator family transporter [Nocardiopsis sp. LOL_012]|uniref:cation diffusion facilitator family transporter n=1 Tax=Nocardiopsis sp. LOL_012 TaxID=3345409 RepID=UPI003A85552C